jgi:hypothetical protein
MMWLLFLLEEIRLEQQEHAMLIDHSHVSSGLPKPGLDKIDEVGASSLKTVIL